MGPGAIELWPLASKEPRPALAELPCSRWRRAFHEPTPLAALQPPPPGCFLLRATPCGKSPAPCFLACYIACTLLITPGIPTSAVSQNPGSPLLQLQLGPRFGVAPSLCTLSKPVSGAIASEGGAVGKMADVTVPMGDPYNGVRGPAPHGTKMGAPAPGYTEPSRKAHRTLHCINFLLRLLTAMATAAALTTMYKSNQTVGRARARWNDFASFKFFLLANAVVLTYATLAALASLLGVVTRRGPLSSAPIAWLTFLMDFLLANALMAAAASATTIAWIGRRGQMNAGWPSQCGVVGGFCRRVLGALIACYIGWVLLALSTILAAAAIHRQRHRRHATVSY